MLLHGVYMRKNFINPLDVEEEDEVDDFGAPTGRNIVNLKARVADCLNLLAVMVGGLTTEHQSMVAYTMMEVYKDFGFTENPDSLYTNEQVFNEETGEFSHVAKKKIMPTLSDFHKKLTELAKARNSYELQRIANSLTMFIKGGIYDIFDCQTSPELANFKNAPLVTFDISKLEESILRPIGMYVAMSWTWEKFVKKNPHIKKRVICDEVTN